MEKNRPVIPRRPAKALLWALSALLLLTSIGIAGYAHQRAMGVGSSLATAGGEARAEAWRQVRDNPIARREYEEGIRLDQAIAEKEARLHEKLLRLSIGLAAVGIAVGFGAWRRRSHP